MIRRDRRAMNWKATVGFATVAFLLSNAPAHAQPSRSDDNAIMLGIAIVMLIGYGLPSFIAFFRKHPNRWFILVINIVLGGTGLGWLFSLIWACSAVHLSPKGSNGGESGLNLFVNDPQGVAQAADRVVPTPSPTPDVVAQLERLQSLRASGAIDEGEFKAMKGKVMG